MNCRKRFAPVSRRRGSGRFHQVFNYSGSGENLVDTENLYSRPRPGWLLATRTLLRHAVPVSPCLRSRINYARYLHTKRPGKIKNTNSEPGEHPRSPISSILSPFIGAALSLASFLPRSLSLILCTLWAIYGRRFPRRHRRYRIIAPGHQSCKLPSAESRNHKFSGNQMIHRAALPDGPATLLQRDTSIVETRKYDSSQCNSNEMKLYPISIRSRYIFGFQEL